MKILPLYKWIAGSQNDFTSQFSNNEQLFNQAKSFWNKLEGSMTIVVIATIVLGILWAIYYYSSYNNAPGRHYKPQHWLIFLAVTFISTLLITLGIEYFMVEPKLKGAFSLELMVSIGNAVYASIVYFLSSVIWCNAFPTNAYRLFKF